MKLMVGTILLFFMISNVHGDPNILIQVLQKVGGNGCGCPGSECCDQTTAELTTAEPTTPEPTTPEPTTTTAEPTTTTFCHTLRTTYCPDGSRCHSNATCILTPKGYICKCNLGYAGDGLDCGEDSDLDSWPNSDLFCCTVLDDHCLADNCPAKPNSGQEDSDFDGIGDACDFTVDPHTGPTVIPTTPFPSNGFCRPRKPDTCLLTLPSDDWRTKDSDGDGHVDSCDNCPHLSNVNQVDSDNDNVGDDCDLDQDTDKDGVDDGADNCLNVCNTDQSDVDYDGDGDACDDDADDDGILNIPDNCWLVPNPGQKDTNNDGFGDACQDDKDGDGCPDDIDPCPLNALIANANFNNFHYVLLNTGPGVFADQPEPFFKLEDEGKEIIETLNSRAGLMYGPHAFTGVDFDGTLFIGDNSDDDYAGFVFGYQSSSSFYVVMWKKYPPGVQVKRVHSITGPSQVLGKALADAYSTADEVTLLWHDPNRIGWTPFTAYRWELIHRPHIGLIRVRFMTSPSDIVVDSGNIYDDNICGGGHLGVYCQSQEDISWSALAFSCNDDSVPQEVYDDLPHAKQADVTVDPFKTWSGVVRTIKKMKPYVSYNASDYMIPDE